MVVGLGPAGTSYLSNEVAALIDSAAASFLRTTRHPAAERFAGADGFDSVYEAADTFEEVYAAMVEALVAAALSHAPDPIVFAVPGSPLVAERAVELLRADDRVDITIVPALSFLDLAWERLGIDPLREGVRLVDAEQFTTQAGGERGPFLVAQCWWGWVLSDIKLTARSDDESELPDVVLLHHLGLDDEQIVRVPWWELDRTLTPDHLTSLYIPALSAATMVEGEMARLEELVLTLRARCPWDRAQTHASLMPHLVEESYEVLDAIAGMDTGDEGRDAASVHLEEELGDLLFQIVFHARLAQEAGQFSLADVARGVHDKLVHRHPHVFGDVAADSAEEVVTNWEAIKKEEKGRTSVTEGIPSQLPALMLSTKLQRKAISVGLVDAGSGSSGAEGRWAEKLAALSRAMPESTAPGADTPLAVDATELAELIGDLLFEVADLSRRLGIDAEQALRARALAYREQIVEAESGVPNPSWPTD